MILVRRICKAQLSTANRSMIYKRTFFGLSSHEGKEQKYVLTRTINAPALNVYDVISEVSKYHEFIPYCVESFVEKRNLKTGKPEEAGLRVGFQQYDERFLCKVNCVSNPKGIKTVVAESLTHGLFDVLYTKWTVERHPTRANASQVELLLKFQFKSRLYNSVASLFAKSVTQLVMKAFERRVFQVSKGVIKAQ
ncbi:LAFE_0E01222g1_1 [Lachancea fermentati]|uniref:LAFE_0E01222g1_1 n=1 Tax=Lachancea fermentati TaxID=4955 RepID=A0A1G4MCG1_LACFM|nr:LAFE_0E01222g1_1 [Lachancea fermentati]